MNLQDVFYFTLTALSILIFGLLSYLIIRAYGQVKDYEDKILKKQHQIDTTIERLLPRVQNGLVTQKQLEGMAEKEKEPLLKELNILKMKRQFILDKIPLISFFKK